VLLDLRSSIRANQDSVPIFRTDCAVDGAGAGGVLKEDRRKVTDSRSVDKAIHKSEVSNIA